MIGYIYKYYNNINDKVYIGQTTDLINRKSSHKRRAEYEKNKFYNAIRKYGWDAFTFTIIVTVDTSEELITKVLDQLEILYISFYNSYKEGYNSTPGGHSARGMKRSTEYREYCRNRQYSQETRFKMSMSAKGRLLSEDTKAKLKDISRTLPHFENRDLYREKTRLARKKALAKKVIQETLDGEVIAEFDSVIEAATFIRDTYKPNLKITGVMRTLLRRLKQEIIKDYNGFVWKYKTKV